MKELTQGLFIGKWKSFKTFRKSGEVKQHSLDYHQEFSFEDCNLLSIVHRINGTTRRIADAQNWTISFKDKRHYLESKDLDLKFEVITINHVALVLQDLSTNDKLFFARPETWEQYVTTSPVSNL
jgi:hypothetical protein